MGIENFVRGAHKRVEYEMPDNCMTDVREILLELRTFKNGYEHLIKQKLGRSQK
jgi:hypothetical protein